MDAYHEFFQGVPSGVIASTISEQTVPFDTDRPARERARQDSLREHLRLAQEVYEVALERYDPAQVPVKGFHTESAVQRILHADWLMWVDAQPATEFAAGVVAALDNLFHHRDVKPANALPSSIQDSWQSLARSGITEPMHAKIVSLANKRDGWRGSGSRGLDAASLRSFLHFWPLVREVAVAPFLTLAPNGNLACEWHSSWKRHLDIEFAAAGSAYFGLFHGRQVIEGFETITNIANMLRARTINPVSWG